MGHVPINFHFIFAGQIYLSKHFMNAARVRAIANLRLVNRCTLMSTVYTARAAGLHRVFEYPVSFESNASAQIVRLTKSIMTVERELQVVNLSNLFIK